MPNEKPRKGRPQQIGSLIPEAARALGFEAELALAQQATLLTSVLNEIAPPFGETVPDGRKRARAPNC